MLRRTEPFQKNTASIEQGQKALEEATRISIDTRKRLGEKNPWRGSEREGDELFDLAELKALATPEGYERLMDLEERLDHMIDKATKRLVQLKAVKQTLGLEPSRSVGL